MAQTLTRITKLLVVREIQEDQDGAAIRFEQGSLGHLALGNANYAVQLRVARRSQERKHPLAATFGEGSAITELVRADNDVPTHLWQDDAERIAVLFQGHDGVFRVRLDHPEFTRMQSLLGEAIRQKIPVWFIAQKPELVLHDMLILTEAPDEKPG